MITETIPTRVAEDTAFQNAEKNSDRENTRIKHDRALQRVMMAIMRDDTELFKQFMDNPDFKRWLGGVMFWGGPTSLDSPRAKLRWTPTGFESPREPSLRVS